MTNWLKIIAGAGIAMGAMAAWNAWPKHTEFRAKALTLTSLTGEPEKSPLAFIEHYHLGLLGLTFGRMASTPTKYYGISPEDAPIFYGLGAALVASELTGTNPFGIGKTPYETAGNVALGLALLGLLFGVK